MSDIGKDPNFNKSASRIPILNASIFVASTYLDLDESELVEKRRRSKSQFQKLIDFSNYPELSKYGDPSFALPNGDLILEDGPIALLSAEAPQALTDVVRMLVAELLDRGNHSYTQGPYFTYGPIRETSLPIEWEVRDVLIGSLHIPNIIGWIDRKRLKTLLISMGATYAGVANYPGFKDGVVQIAQDVEYVANFAADHFSDLLNARVSKPETRIIPIIAPIQDEDHDDRGPQNNVPLLNNPRDRRD